MASPNSTFTELVTTTYRKHSKTFADNTSNHTALAQRMNKKGRKRTEDGGLSIVEMLDYGDNGTYQRYSGYDVLNIQASDVLSAAEYQWRSAAMHITASGEEMRKNSGETRIANLVKSRITNAFRGFRNNFSSDLYSSGSLSNQINGLQALVSDAGTGTVGGIVSGTYTWWKSIVQSAAAPLSGGAITVSATTIEPFFLQLYLALTRNGDQPDLIVADDTYYTFYESSQVSIKRYTSANRAQGGFLELAFKNADVIYDGADIPDAHAYFLNTDYLQLVVHPDADMTMMERMSNVNQDAVVIPILWMGNLVCSNRSLQGVAKA